MSEEIQKDVTTKVEDIKTVEPVTQEEIDIKISDENPDPVTGGVEITDENPDVPADDKKPEANPVTAVTEAVKETVSAVKEAVESPAVTKKATWWNRIWSGFVGALLAVAAMFGITTDQVAEQKENVKQVKTLASEALESIKKGDIATAQAKLNEAQEVGKEVVEKAKEAVETIKKTDKKEVVEKVKNALTSANTKTVKTAATQYTQPAVTTTVKK
jgi:hypothetical protein